MKPLGRLSLLALVAVGGCGSQDPAAGNAGRILGIVWEALTESERAIENADDPDPEKLQTATALLEEAKSRFLETQESVRIWQRTGTGSVGWHTYAPCLATSIRRLQSALEDADIPAPLSLDQAATMTDAASDGECREGP